MHGFLVKDLCSQHGTIAHFGLDTSQIVDSVIIKWPSGHIDKLYNISADQLLHIHEGQTGLIQVQILSTMTSAPCSNANTLLYSNGVFADYIWSTGDTTSSVSISSSSMYHVTATDHNGYISYDSIFILLDYNDSLVLQYTDVLCYGASNGTASVQYQGATGIVEYNWSTGSTSSTLTGLQLGSYSVSILNSTGCPDSASVQISTPTQLSLQENLQQIACFDDSSGSIDLSIQGGTPPIPIGQTR